jgi:hypothetical protein
MDHETKIITKKQIIINYKVQYSINQVLQNEIREKNIDLKKRKKENNLVETERQNKTRTFRAKFLE